MVASVASGDRRAQSVEATFRALTSVNSEGAAIRRPLTFKKLRAETGATADDLRPILDAFRASGVSFVTPYAPRPIEDKTPIDISHEALIRCWRKINPDGWLQREIRDGLAWRALLDQAEAFAKDRKSFLSEPATEVRGPSLKGRNAAWAARYDGGWSKVENLINASEKHWEGERPAREARQRENLEKALAANAEGAVRPTLHRGAGGSEAPVRQSGDSWRGRSGRAGADCHSGRCGYAQRDPKVRGA